MALTDYLEGNLYPASRLLPLLRLRVQRGEAYPALAGSALRGTGVRELLDAVVDLLPPPPGDAQAPLSGVVFAISDEDAMGRAARVRLFSGTLKNRDTVQLPDASGRMPGAQGGANSSAFGGGTRTRHRGASRRRNRKRAGPGRRARRAGAGRPGAAAAQRASGRVVRTASAHQGDASRSRAKHRAAAGAASAGRARRAPHRRRSSREKCTCV